MKRYLNLNWLFSFVLFLTALSAIQVQAKLYTPNFEESFYRQLGRHKLAIVHFNPYEEDEIDVPGLERMKRAFTRLSKITRYKEADIAFIGVNLQELPGLAQDFDIPLFKLQQAKADGNIDEDDDDGKIEANVKDVSDVVLDVPAEQQATLMLFKDGRPFKLRDTEIKETGFQTRAEIEDFIEHYFGEYIDDIIREKRERQASRERTRPKRKRIVRYVYSPRRYRAWGPYWGYGQPWGYWGRWGRWGGWGRPGFSFGFGW